MLKKIYTFFIISFICLIQIQAVFSQGMLNPALKTEIETDTNKIKAFDQGQTVWSIASLVIKAFLSLIAVIFLILILIAGYNWMTAGGNEDKVKKAKDTMQRAAIGFVIIVSAYIITVFVMKNLPGV